MSNFDISEYLNSKNDFTTSGIPEVSRVSIPEMSGKLPDETPTSKTEALLAARRLKEELLKEESFNKQRLLAKENESSLITKLGLDYDSAAGIAAGVVASGVSGIARTASYGLTAAPRAYTALSEATGAMTPEYANRVRQGIESFDEMFTRAPKSLADTRSKEAFKESYFSDPTANEALGRIANTNLDNVGLSTVKDLGTLVANAIKTVPNEPVGFLNLLAENSPQIALAIATQGGSAVANAGYALSYYDKWSTGFEQKYNRPPTEAEKAEASAKASALFLSEFIGDASIGAISKAAPKGLISNISTEAFKDSLLGNTGKVLTKTTATAARPVVEFAKAAIPEAITEGLQTKLEGDLEFKPATKEDIYFGAGIGGLTAGAMLAPSTLAKSTGDVVEAVQTVADKVKEALPTNATRDTEAYNTAVETGDVTPLVNKPNPLQNDWVGATEAIIENASLEGKTDEDVKAALGKVDKEIVSKLEASIKSFSLNTEAKVDIYNKEIEKINAFLEQNPDSEKAKALLAKYTAERDAPIDPDKEAQANKFIGQLQTKLNEVVSLREGLAARETESEANVIEAAKAITTPPSTTGTTDTTKPAVDVPTFIVRAMKLRGSKSPELVTAIESVISSGKATPEEIKTLRILADEVIASNKAKNVSKVSENVLFGSGEIKEVSPTPGIDFKGVFNYQETFEKALSIGDKETANKEFEGLKSFVIAHGKKREAYSQLKPNQMVEFTNKGEWQIRDIPKGYTQQQAVEEARKNGGFAWFGNKPNKGYTNTMANIDNEISIMVPVLQKMSLQIGKPINNEEVVSVKQTPKAKQASQEGQEVSGTTAVNTGTKQTGTGTSEAPTQPTVKTSKDSFVSLFDTDNSFNQWTNTETDRDAFTKLISSSFDVYKKLNLEDTPKNRQLLLEELKPQKWSKNVDLNKAIDFLVKEKVSVTPEGTSTPNNIGAPNGQGQKERVLTTSPTEVGSGSTQQPTTASPTGQEAVDTETKLLKELSNSLGIPFDFKVRELSSLTKEDNPSNFKGGLYFALKGIFAIDSKYVGAQRMSVLLHELGHHITYSFIAKTLNVSLAEVEQYSDNKLKMEMNKLRPEIVKEYQDWLRDRKQDINTKTGRVSYVRSAISRIFYDQAVADGINVDNKTRYTSFNEWMADNIGKALERNTTSQNTVQKFFSDIANAFRKAYEIISNTKALESFMPAKTVMSWIEQLTKENATEASVVNDSVTPEQQELINESQKELFEEKAASTTEATAEGESQGSTDDTTGDGTSSSDNSDELNAGEEVIKEEARYTSKKEALKAIEARKEALLKFAECIGY